MRRCGYSLMEILVVLLVLMIVIASVLALFNPKKQIERAWDGKKRNELASLQKTFSDFYNDKSTFPIATEICYDSVQEQDGVCSCHICGDESTSPTFTPYINRVACDPEHPRKMYLYQYDCGGLLPSWYRICAYINEDAAPGYSYNYGVSSLNIDVEACNIEALITPTPPGGPTSTPTPPGGPTATPTPTPIPTSTPGASPTPTNTPTPTPTPAICPPDPTSKFCYISGICNNCGTYGNCNNVCDIPSELYKEGDQTGCRVPCVP